MYGYIFLQRSYFKNSIKFFQVFTFSDLSVFQQFANVMFKFDEFLSEIREYFQTMETIWRCAEFACQICKKTILERMTCQIYQKKVVREWSDLTSPPLMGRPGQWIPFRLEDFAAHSHKGCSLAAAAAAAAGYRLLQLPTLISTLWLITQND